MSEVYRLLAALGGLRPGHTAFKSGEHGDGWIEKGALIATPTRLSEVVRSQARILRERWPEAEVVVGSAQCGAALAALVAQELGLRVAFTSRAGDGKFGFHRMFVPPEGALVALAEDLVFSGRDVRDQAQFFAGSGLRLLGVTAWAARANANLGEVPLHTLMPHPFKTWSAEECPLCREGMELEWRDIRE